MMKSQVTIYSAVEEGKKSKNVLYVHSLSCLLFLCCILLPNTVTAKYRFNESARPCYFKEIAIQQENKYYGKVALIEHVKLEPIRIAKKHKNPEKAAAKKSNDKTSANGCCKHRKSEKARWQKKEEYEFNECKTLNKVQDQDDVNEAKGTVWWDKGCRPK